MGKIFDALEKASRQSGQVKKSSNKTEKVKFDNSDKSNIVPFVNAKSKVAGEGLDPNLITINDPDSVEAEIFKSLRTTLLFPSKGKAPKSILVTSAMPGDGKTFVSANLAISIARGVEEHVLLIDADVRNPKINTFFKIEKQDGLSEYLNSGVDVSVNFAKTIIPKLTILPAGKPPKNPTELLTTHKMRLLIEEATSRYNDRFVIIDSAPPSLASETSAIAKYVDGIIIVVKAGTTHRSMIDEMIEQLGKEKIIGIVLNYSNSYKKKYYGYGKPYLKS